MSKESLKTGPEVEVSAKAKRRRFTADYKRKILQEASLCTKHGELGALLRREGLYSSHLIAWRGLVAQGGLGALAEKKRGPKSTHDARDKKIVEQERVIARLTRRAERAEALVELQKKVSELLGIQLPDPDEKTS